MIVSIINLTKRIISDYRCVATSLAQYERYNIGETSCNCVYEFHTFNRFWIDPYIFQINAKKCTDDTLKDKYSIHILLENDGHKYHLSVYDTTIDQRNITIDNFDRVDGEDVAKAVNTIINTNDKDIASTEEFFHTVFRDAYIELADSNSPLTLTCHHIFVQLIKKVLS